LRLFGSDEISNVFSVNLCSSFFEIRMSPIPVIGRKSPLLIARHSVV